jgi:hypothetical protein
MTRVVRCGRRIRPLQDPDFDSATSGWIWTATAGWILSFGDVPQPPLPGVSIRTTSPAFSATVHLSGVDQSERPA